MKHSESRRGEVSEDIFVIGSAPSSTGAGSPFSAAAEIPGDRHPCSNQGDRLNCSDSRAAQWAAYDPQEREVFRTWARAVGAFYSLIIVALLAAMLLGARATSGPNALSAATTLQGSAAGAFASGAGIAGK
jgi:hypothetical protein